MRVSTVALGLAFALIGVFGLLFRHTRVQHSKRAQPAPSDISPDRVHQLGVIWEDIPTTVPVVLTNPSDHVLAVERIHALCPCSSVAPRGPFTIRPREKKRLTLEFKVQSSTLAYEQSLSMRLIPQYSSGETGTGWLLKGTLRRPFLHAPQLPLDIGSGDFPISRHWDFQLSSGLELVSVSSNSNSLQTTHRELTATTPSSHRYRVTTRLSPSVTGMGEQYRIELAVKDERSGEHLRPIVLVAVWKPLVLIPESVAIGAEPVGSRREETIVLQPGRGTIEKVEARPADDTTMVTETAVKPDGTGATVRIRQRIAKAGSNRMSVTLWVQMRDGKGTKYVLQKEVPISYYGIRLSMVNRSPDDESTSNGRNEPDIESRVYHDSRDAHGTGGTARVHRIEHQPDDR